MPAISGISRAGNSLRATSIDCVCSRSCSALLALAHVRLERLKRVAREAPVQIIRHKICYLHTIHKMSPTWFRKMDLSSALALETRDFTVPTGTLRISATSS